MLVKKNISIDIANIRKLIRMNVRYEFNAFLHNNISSFKFQEYSVQITFRQKWNDDRLSYANRLAIGDMSSKYIDTKV